MLGDKAIGVNHYPGYYTTNPSFLVPTSAYAPRQVQLAANSSFKLGEKSGGGANIP